MDFYRLTALHMGIFNLFSSPPTIHIADCLSRKITRIANPPASLSGKTVDGEVTDLCRISQKGRNTILTPLDPDSLPLLDGQAVAQPTALQNDHEYSLCLRGHLLVLFVSNDDPVFAKHFDEPVWIVAKRDAPNESRRIDAHHLNRAILSRSFVPLSNYVARPDGCLSHFNLADLYELLPEIVETAKPAQSDFGKDAASLVEPEEGHACPTCWKSFSVGEVMNIASHTELTGDPVLGPHARLRFHAERFNELGQAIDPKGVVSVDLACPHCRGRLPPSFLSQRQLILSLVGAPSSGKSYYLAVLLKKLPEELIRNFNTNLQDADPSGNVHLNEMKNRLFSATTREDAFISKTDFEGLMYERLMRNGQLVPLPRPFVYNLQRINDPEKRASLVFYDNAGEHFKPSISIDDSPGAMHVAASTALFFLFDPATNRSFRKALNTRRDVQLKSQGTDEQDVILAEMGVRIKKLKALDSHEKIDTPLAVMVGKFDLWKHLVPEDAIAHNDGQTLNPATIESNSLRTRELLLQLCPTIVANAESISNRVMYFPISPLGHSPKEIKFGPLAGKLAPYPRNLDPILATAPSLWALRQIAGDIIEDEQPSSPNRSQ